MYKKLISTASDTIRQARYSLETACAALLSALIVQAKTEPDTAKAVMSAFQPVIRDMVNDAVSDLAEKKLPFDTKAAQKELTATAKLALIEAVSDYNHLEDGIFSSFVYLRLKLALRTKTIQLWIESLVDNRVSLLKNAGEPYDVDDLRQELVSTAHLSFYKAVKRHDEKKHGPFTDFANKAVKGSIERGISQRRAEAHRLISASDIPNMAFTDRFVESKLPETESTDVFEVYLDAVSADPSVSLSEASLSGHFDLRNMAPTDEDFRVIADLEAATKVSRAELLMLNGIDERNREIFLRILNRESHKDIAESEKCVPENISRMKRNIIERLLSVLFALKQTDIPRSIVTEKEREELVAGIERILRSVKDNPNNKLNFGALERIALQKVNALVGNGYLSLPTDS